MEEIIKWGLYVLTGIMGWFIRILWDAQKELRDDMKKIELNLSEKYTKKEDFKEAIHNMKDDFKELTVPLFKKLDKIEEYLLHRNRDGQ